MSPSDVPARAATVASTLGIEDTGLSELSFRGVDTHGHVFTRHMRMIKRRRYTPQYDATIADYLAACRT